MDVENNITTIKLTEIEKGKLRIIIGDFLEKYSISKKRKYEQEWLFASNLDDKLNDKNEEE